MATMTKAEAFGAMLVHHARLGEEMQDPAGAVRRAAESGLPFEPAVAELVAFAREEVLPHAFAEEGTVYKVASTRPGLASTVEEMIGEHRALVERVEELASGVGSAGATAKADALADLFGAHVTKENVALLPPLLEDDEVDLAGVLGEMHELIVASRAPELDVRRLAPARRHETIFATYSNLAPGESFVLVNDHDPKPLRYQFEAEHAGHFTWDYLETGPRTWRVRIGR